jgi:hypothetical protein
MARTPTRRRPRQRRVEQAPGGQEEQDAPDLVREAGLRLADGAQEVGLLRACEIQPLRVRDDRAETCVGTWWGNAGWV